MTMTPERATVRDNPVRHRYEIHDGGQLAGFAEYRLDGQRITFTHTQTEPAFNGRGLARQLVIQALDDARRRELTVRPLCPYVRKVISSEPGRFLDLVTAEDRSRFALTGGADVDQPDVRPIPDAQR